MMIEEK